MEIVVKMLVGPFDYQKLLERCHFLGKMTFGKLGGPKHFFGIWGRGVVK